MQPLHAQPQHFRLVQQPPPQQQQQQFAAYASPHQYLITQQHPSYVPELSQLAPHPGQHYGAHAQPHHPHQAVQVPPAHGQPPAQATAATTPKPTATARPKPKSANVASEGNADGLPAAPVPTGGLTCLQCRMSKVKCDKTYPCGRCVRLGLTCLHQVRKRGRKSTTMPDNAGMEGAGRGSSAASASSGKASGGGGYGGSKNSGSLSESSAAAAASGRRATLGSGSEARTAAQPAAGSHFDQPRFSAAQQYEQHQHRQLKQQQRQQQLMIDSFRQVALYLFQNNRIKTDRRVALLALQHVVSAAESFQDGNALLVWLQLTDELGLVDQIRLDPVVNSSVLFDSNPTNGDDAESRLLPPDRLKYRVPGFIAESWHHSFDAACIQMLARGGKVIFRENQPFHELFVDNATVTSCWLQARDSFDALAGLLIAPNDRGDFFAALAFLMFSDKREAETSLVLKVLGRERPFLALIEIRLLLVSTSDLSELYLIIKIKALPRSPYLADVSSMSSDHDPAAAGSQLLMPGYSLFERHAVGQCHAPQSVDGQLSQLQHKQQMQRLQEFRAAAERDQKGSMLPDVSSPRNPGSKHPRSPRAMTLQSMGSDPSLAGSFRRPKPDPAGSSDSMSRPFKRGDFKSGFGSLESAASMVDVSLGSMSDLSISGLPELPGGDSLGSGRLELADGKTGSNGSFGSLSFVFNEDVSFSKIDATPATPSSDSAPNSWATAAADAPR